MTAEIQRRVELPDIPGDDELQRFAAAVLDGTSQVNIRIVDEAEGRALNKCWRGKDCATNVLGFPADLPKEIQPPFLGDVVLCAPVIAREAREQGKPVEHHYAHLVIHGILHLQGFDHIEAGGAEEMERRERALLAGLGIPDPFESAA